MHHQVVFGLVPILVIGPVFGCSVSTTEEVQQPAQADSPLQPAQVGSPPQPTEAEKFQVKLAALRHMFENLVPPAGGRSINGNECFIVKGDGDAKRLAESFSTFRFPVFGPDQLAFKDGRAIDKTTEALAKSWDVKAVVIDGARAIVTMTWYSGHCGAGELILNLTKSGEVWSVHSIESGWIS